MKHFGYFHDHIFCFLLQVNMWFGDCLTHFINWETCTVQCKEDSGVNRCFKLSIYTHTIWLVVLTRAYGNRRVLLSPFLFCLCSSDFSSFLCFISKCFVPIFLVNFKNTIIFCSISDTKKKIIQFVWKPVNKQLQYL